MAKPGGSRWPAIKGTGMPNVSTGTVPSEDTGLFKAAWNAQNL